MADSTTQYNEKQSVIQLDFSNCFK